MIEKLLEGKDWVESGVKRHDNWRRGELIVCFVPPRDTARSDSALMIPFEQYHPAMGSLISFRHFDGLEARELDTCPRAWSHMINLIYHLATVRLVAADRVQEPDLEHYVEAIQRDVIRMAEIRGAQDICRSIHHRLDNGFRPGQIPEFSADRFCEMVDERLREIVEREEDILRVRLENLNARSRRSVPEQTVVSPEGESANGTKTTTQRGSD